MLRVESFTVGTAEPRTVQLGGGGASAITEAIAHPEVTRPLLTQPAVAKATCNNRDSLYFIGAQVLSCELCCSFRAVRLLHLILLQQNSLKKPFLSQMLCLGGFGFSL